MQNEFFRRTRGNRIHLWTEGEEYYTRYLQLIREATESVHLQTYIFAEDRFARAVQQELIEASERGVGVYVVVDSVGSMAFSHVSEKALRAAGVKFCRFNGLRFRWLGQWGRRLHHKVLMADNRIALVGGINVVSESYQNEQNVPHQLDFAVELEGPVSSEIARYCQKIFSKACRPHEKFKAPEAVLPQPDGVDLKISINDWIYRRWQITRQYSELTKVAEKDILILNSYFFPRPKFMKQLSAAVKRGVRVRLILPRFSDWPSYVKATQYLYAYFLKHGIEVYEWKNSIMHGKLASIDGNWSTVGSFNLNYTSYQQNLEMNVDVHDARFTEDMNTYIDQLIQEGCEKIEAQTFAHRSGWSVKVSRFMFYVLLSLIANFSIGLSVQEDRTLTPFQRILLVGATMLLVVVGLLGLLLPIMPGIPFLVVAIILIYRQVRSNEKNV